MGHNDPPGLTVFVLELRRMFANERLAKKFDVEVEFCLARYRGRAARWEAANRALCSTEAELKRRHSLSTPADFQAARALALRRTALALERNDAVPKVREEISEIASRLRREEMGQASQASDHTS